MGHLADISCISLKKSLIQNVLFYYFAAGQRVLDWKTSTQAAFFAIKFQHYSKNHSKIRRNDSRHQLKYAITGGSTLEKL